MQTSLLCNQDRGKQILHIEDWSGTSKIIPFQCFLCIFHQWHIFMPTSSIGNNIQMLLVSFIDNEVVNDTSLIICKHCQSSRVILQPLDVGHGEAFHEQISVLAINSGLEHVRHIKDRTVLPKMKKMWGFLSVNGKADFYQKKCLPSMNLRAIIQHLFMR